MSDRQDIEDKQKEEAEAVKVELQLELERIRRRLASQPSSAKNFYLERLKLS